MKSTPDIVALMIGEVSEEATQNMINDNY